MQINLESLSLALQFVAFAAGVVLAAYWLGLVVWTARDIWARTHDLLSVLLSVLLVLVFNLLGLALYLLIRPKETLAEAYERALEEETLLQALEERPVCPSCQRWVEPDFILCPYCRETLKHPCPQCDRLIREEWEICPYCGFTPEEPEPTEQWDTATKPLPQAMSDASTG